MFAFTWIVFLINPCVGSIFVILGFKNDRKNYIHYSIMLSLLFAALAYWFIPSHEMDLTRYFDILNIYSNMTWNEFVDYRLMNNILVIQELIFYIIAQSNNFYLLPALSVFIVYFVSFYQISDYAIRMEISSKQLYTALLVTILILPFPTIVSNVRNVMAFALFSLAVYRDLIQNKRNSLTILLYVIPCFIHISTLALVIIRITTKFIKLNRKRSLIVYGVTIFGVFLFSSFAKIASGTILYNNPIISSFISKADYYINDVSSEYALHLQNSVFFQLQKFYFVAVVLFFLLLAFLLIKRIDKRNSIELKNNFLLYLLLTCFVVIGTVPIILTVYMRFVIPVIMMFYFLYFSLNKYNLNSSMKLLLNFVLFIITIGGIVQQVALLVQLTNIENMITSVIIRSMFNMFIQ